MPSKASTCPQGHGEGYSCGLCVDVRVGPIYIRPEDWGWFEYYRDRTFVWMKIGPLVVEAFRMHSTGWKCSASWRGAGPC